MRRLRSTENDLNSEASNPTGIRPDFHRNFMPGALLLRESARFYQEVGHSVGCCADFV